MDKEEAFKMMRRAFNKDGWALLIYYVLLNTLVILVCFVDTLLEAIKLFQRPDLTGVMTVVMGIFQESLMNNGLGYLLATAVGLLLMYCWKKRQFCLEEIWTKEKPMNRQDFVGLLCVFIACQAVFQVITIIIESILNAFGLSALASIESATSVGSSFSMFLYAALVAPVAEEILFRGLILRNLLPFGKKFAIFGSALLFGAFHGNIVQTPYAFLVGLVLGYTAVHYSIRWAIVLHLINNFVLSQLLGKLSAMLPELVGNMILVGIVWGCAVAACLILVIRRKDVQAYAAEGKIHPWSLRSFFSSPGILAFLIIMLINTALPLIMQML